ncbi:SatD family protein [Nocardioides sp. YIM 152588]|uniref:SatD family protein n=1 Tax=Nocardioides sp. YIM 152588 TaxID=3158259 RepID=UPI0032E472FE
MLTATLIGDVVDSRESGDRAHLHERLTATLAGVNRRHAPTLPLRITVGDEFQGRFGTVAQALAASLELRLALLPAHDLRHGIGWGEVTVLDDDPRVEDGPGWWAARDAIHHVQEAEERPASRSRRTAFVAAPAAGSERGLADGLADALAGAAGAVNAALVLRDHVVGGLDERSLAILRGLLAGTSQRDLAAGLGVTPSAISQRIRADGLAALVESERLLTGAVPGADTRLAP